MAFDDVLKVNENFISIFLEKFKNINEYNSVEDEERVNKYIEEMISYDMFINCVEGSFPEISVYLTEDSLVISIAVPYSLGSFALYSAKYIDIIGYLNIDIDGKVVLAELEKNENVHTNDNESNLLVEEAQIQIERIDDSIKSESGEILANIYYDKPAIEGVEFSEKINTFFENEKDGWFNGANRLTHFQHDWLQNFKESVSKNRDRYGDDAISKQPFLYTVDSDVASMDEDYLSIRQIVTFQTAGPRSCYYFGSTFDLHTGEIIPIDKLVEIDANDFRNAIVSFLLKEKLKLDQNFTIQDIRELYGENDKGNYQTQYDDENIELNYEYYYDGESFYIILNHAIFVNAGIIMKWNGKLNDDFNAQLIGYIKENDGGFKLIEY